MAGQVVRNYRTLWVTRVELPEQGLPRQRCVLEGEALRMADLVVKKDRTSWVTRVEHPEPGLPRQRCVLEGEALVIVNH